MLNKIGPKILILKITNPYKYWLKTKSEPISRLFRGFVRYTLRSDREHVPAQRL